MASRPACAASSWMSETCAGCSGTLAARRSASASASMRPSAAVTGRRPWSASPPWSWRRADGRPSGDVPLLPEELDQVGHLLGRLMVLVHQRPKPLLEVLLARCVARLIRPGGDLERRLVQVGGGLEFPQGLRKGIVEFAELAQLFALVHRLSVSMLLHQWPVVHGRRGVMAISSPRAGERGSIIPPHPESAKRRTAAAPSTMLHRAMCVSKLAFVIA